MRFAPIIRVRTEEQEKKGESLRTQKKQIIQYVKYFNGKNPEYCWQYSGQEHATPDQERIKLDRLLKDSDKNLFDAVIVCDASPWSRDNQKSKAGLQILKNNGIKFFVGTTEFNRDYHRNIKTLNFMPEVGAFEFKYIDIIRY